AVAAQADIDAARRLAGAVVNRTAADEDVEGAGARFRFVGPTARHEDRANDNKEEEESGEGGAETGNHWQFPWNQYFAMSAFWVVPRPFRAELTPSSIIRNSLPMATNCQPSSMR